MMEPTSTDEYLTVAEIADLLKVNQQSVRNWIFSPGVGVLPGAAGLRRW
jgi:hypothetical protein